MGRQGPGGGRGTETTGHEPSVSGGCRKIGRNGPRQGATETWEQDTDQRSWASNGKWEKLDGWSHSGSSWWWSEGDWSTSEPWQADRRKKAEAEPPPLELPIDAHRERILRHVREHRVTHIQGETGCGKSTRLPQFLLEDAQPRGQPRIVVTQPRRMAAVTLARRVASVLGEELGAGTVGYRISGDVVDGRLCFVTVGYLLQRLVNCPEDFGRYTHVILDEVHERGVDADLLSMLVKLLMHCFPSVKLVVMSATLQAALFANYFASLSSNGRPPEVLFVGARVYPVEQIFLDDVGAKFDFSDPREGQLLDSALAAFTGMGKGRHKGDKGKGKSKAEESFKRVEPQISEGLVEVCVVLLQQLARRGCTVIVFLPGIADITSMFEALAPLDTTREGRWPERISVRAGCPRLRVFALHSMIPRTEQEEVFRDVPEDCCHIVLASNIAESSLTLPSVCAVVDLALRRSVQYDTRRLMCCLVTTWCSQSSCKQRTGRAGRTLPGRAVCLVPRRFFETQMPLFDPPEMLSAPLTKLYLQAKQLCTTLEASKDKLRMPPDVRMDVSAPKALLNEVVQSPSMALLEAAMTELAAVGCLTSSSEDAEITPLGRVAIALPCDLRICRLLYFGCLFRCPCDAIAMAAGLTAADPFSAPSLLVLKDQKEYVQKLERSFAARRWCDNGAYSEPLMLHTLFVEWIRVGAPRGLKGLGQFAREWSVMPRKFESLACDAIDLTVRILKLLGPRCAPRAQVEALLSAMHHSVDRHEDLVRVSSRARPERVFCRDVETIRALIALAFSDQMLLHLNPRWAPNGTQKKKRQEEQILQLIRSRELEVSRSAAFFVPAGQDEDSMRELCTAMCGEAPEALFYEEKNKVAVVTFRQDSEPLGAALLWDVPAAIHRLHQFGSGRYRFLVELPGRDQAPVELFKPLQPFLLQWQVLSHPGDGRRKKPSSVRGMCDWRNPLGFACHANDALPPTELLGCCASVQGLEGGSQAFVAGATVLPLRFLPVLLGTLCPERWSLSWAVDAQSGEVRGIRVLHHEVVNLPPKTLAPRVLSAVNELRSALREALSPAWDWEACDWKPRPQAELLEPPDLSEPLQTLLELLPAESASQRPRKIKWRPAAGQWEEEDYLQPLRPLGLQEEANEWSGLLAHLAEHGECLCGSLPQWLRRPKKHLEKRPDLFSVRVTREGCFVSLAAKKPKADQQLLDAITQLLTNKGRPVGLGELGSSAEVKSLLRAQDSKMQRIRPFLQAFPDRFNFFEDHTGQLVVALRSEQGRGARARPKPARVKAEQARAGAVRRGGGSALQDRIAKLCHTSPALVTDFDGRVCQFLRDLQDKQGAAALDDTFEMLHSWLNTKGHREEVQNWSGYIMTLLTRAG